MHVNRVNFHHKTIHHFSGLKIGEINKIVVRVAYPKLVQVGGAKILKPRLLNLHKPTHGHAPSKP